MTNEPVQWNPSFETGLLLIDEEHRGLLERLNTLIALLANQAAAADWLPELDRLITEVDTHFRHEEQMMENIGYPGYPAHRQQHQHLLQEVAQFRAQVTAQNAAEDTLATVRFLKFWVLKHMVQEDAKIKQHLYRGLPAGSL